MMTTNTKPLCGLQAVWLWTNNFTAANSRLASCGVACLNSSEVLLLGFSGRLTVKCSESRTNAKRQNVSCNPKEQTTMQKSTIRQTTKKPTLKMAHLVFTNTRANAQKTKRAIFLPTL
jgi:Ulp1 family protease